MLEREVDKEAILRGGLLSLIGLHLPDDLKVADAAEQGGGSHHGRW